MANLNFENKPKWTWPDVYSSAIVKDIRERFPGQRFYVRTGSIECCADGIYGVEYAQILRGRKFWFDKIIGASSHATVGGYGPGRLNIHVDPEYITQKRLFEIASEIRGIPAKDN